MLKRLLILFLLFAASAAAQTQTLVSGTLTDPNGVAYYPATVTACLSPSTLNPTVGGRAVNPNPGANYCVGPTNTSINGFFSMALWGNANITPGGTTWIFTVQASGTPPPAGNGTLNFSSAGVTVSGATQDVSGSINSVGTVQLKSSSSGGLSLVSSGLLADCQLTEGSGTTPSCGAAGAGTFGTGLNAPLWIGTAQNPLYGPDIFPGAATGPQWTAVDGTFTVSGNGISVASIGTLAVLRYTGQDYVTRWNGAAGTSPTSDMYVSTTVKAPSTSTSDGIGPACRVTGVAPPNTNFYAVDFRGGTTNQYRLYKRINNSFSILGSAAGTEAVNDVLTIVCQGNQISAQKNGVTILGPFTDTGQLTGQPGLAGSSPTNTGSITYWHAGSIGASTTGGIQFGGGQFVTLPASLNSAKTIQLFACYQISQNGNTINSPIHGNGNGSTGNSIGIDLASVSASDTSPLTQILPRVQVWGGNAYTTTQHGLLNGCGVIGSSFGTSPTFDHTYINGIEGVYNQNVNGSAGGLQTVGNYQLGGTAAGSGNATQTYYTGQIYDIVFYNRELSQSEILQNTTALIQRMQARGVNVSSGWNNTSQSSCVNIGDSISNGFGLAAGQTWNENMTFYNPANGETFANSGHCWNQGITAGLVRQLSDVTTVNEDPLLNVRGTRNFVTIWAGTNDMFYGYSAAQTLGSLSTLAKQKRAAGWKVIVVDMISRGTGASCVNDGNFQAFDPLLHALWSTFADGYVTMSDVPNFATNGCTTNLYQADNTHPSAHGQINVISPLIEREVNTIYGNLDWNVASTYTTTALAATATTAGSESGNTVTITTAATPANVVVGTLVTVAGVTPAGYNGDFLVLTRTATQITYFNPTTGLGAISVQGTIVAPQEQDQDALAILGGSAAGPIHTLETCQGRSRNLPGRNYTIARMITNTNATPWVITPWKAGETINGAATMNAPVATATNHPVLVLRAVQTSPTTGACTWQASIE